MSKALSESPTIRSYRELLGVGPSATADDLKKSYHRLALLYHPDRNASPGAPLEFQKVRSAYEVLSDPLRVRALNESHIRERLFDNIVDGLNVCFGAFFGYRLFHGPDGRIAKHLRLGREKAGERDLDPFERLAGPVERDLSILDNPAYDNLEIVYAGRISGGDEEHLQSGFDNRHLLKLPWVVLNNQGILFFLDDDVRRALSCYAELNERIPNNIVFMYRLALCHIVLGCRFPQRTMLGFLRPDRIEIEKGIQLLRKCIRIGTTRTVGKQRCLVIRKLLADVLEKTGRRRQALRLWREIREFNPHSVEAVWKTKGLRAARELLDSRKRPISAAAKDGAGRKLLGSSRRR